MKRKIDIIALIILIAAAVNCGLIGVLRFNVMTWLFNGQSVAARRIIYVLVAAAGLWCLNLIAVQGRRNRIMRNAALDPALHFDPRSQKENPTGETACSPNFSQGYISKDTDSPVISEEVDDNESH